MGIPNLKQYGRQQKAPARAPTILREPSNQQIRLGARLSISVIVDNVESTSFQWYHNGQKIPRATSYRFAITQTKYENAGSYSCEVKNSFGSTTSRVANVAFVEQEIQSILLQPALATIPSGRTFTFFVDSAGTDFSRCKFQWLFNGSKIRGAIGPKLEIYEVKKKHEGEYKALIVMGTEIISTNASKLRVIQSEKFPFAKEEIIPSENSLVEDFFYDPSKEFPREEKLTENTIEAIEDAPIEPMSFAEPAEVYHPEPSLELPTLEEPQATEQELLPITEDELSLALTPEEPSKHIEETFAIDEPMPEPAVLPTEPRPVFAKEEVTKSISKKRSALEKMLTLFSQKVEK